MTDATLSPLEHKIYFAAKDAKDKVIFLETIEAWNLTDKKTLLSIISKMVKKSWLIRLRRGVYLITEPNIKNVEDPFIIAPYVFPGYVAFSSALYLHKLTDMYPFEIYVATRNESGTKKFGQFTFRGIAIKKRHKGSGRKGNYIVSSIPKTLYDCLKYPELAGGFEDVLEALYSANLTKKEWDMLLFYAKEFEKNAFFQRLGYLLELLPKKNENINRVIGICAKKVKSKIYLYKRKNGKYNKKWKIVDDIGKEMLISWWY